MKIGLFGGSFNPVHLGHLNIMKHSFKELDLDRLILIPCYQSVDKKISDYISPFHRIKMLEEVLIPNCFISLFEVNQRRSIQSFETVRYFKSVFPQEKLFFILGEDNLLGIESWENISEINNLTQIVIFKRFPNSRGFIPKVPLNLLWMNNDIWDYSSTDFRKNHSKILDKKVEKYIRDNNLYNLSN